ncbi:hypothetical protein F5X98DRAFT_357095 [Xylaria grammica]|nr:hypothetical protein F5X98DRAFT_357095 [Xylaria grammica]
MIQISLCRWRGAYYCYLILSLLPFVRAQWPTRQLETFFPAWDYYLHDTDCTSSRKADLDAGEPGAYYDAIECLLKAFPEYRKSEIAASSVALGLLPTILSLLGPSITDQAVLSMRRPLLAFLLAAGSPAVNPQLRDEYTALIERKLSSGANITRTGPRRSVWSKRVILVSLVEHAAALGAMLNIAILAYQLSIFAVTSFAVRWGYLPALWAGLTLLIHGASFLALRVKVHKRYPEREGPAGRRRRNDSLSSFSDSCVAEVTPCKHQQSMTLQWCGEDELRYKLGSVVVWMLNFGIVVHIFLGTLTLSGLLFISAADAISIVARFVASTVVSQLIFTYELSGIKKTTFIIDSVSTSTDNAPNDIEHEGTEMGLMSSEPENS